MHYCQFFFIVVAFGNNQNEITWQARNKIMLINNTVNKNINITINDNCHATQQCNIGENNSYNDRERS